MLRVINYVADAIRDEFPAVAIDTLAYQYTRPAPNKTKPRGNVIVRLCSIECNFLKPLTDPSNAAFTADIIAWSRISDRLYICKSVNSPTRVLACWPMKDLPVAAVRAMTFVCLSVFAHHAGDYMVNFESWLLPWPNYFVLVRLLPPFPSSRDWCM